MGEEQKGDPRLEERLYADEYRPDKVSHLDIPDALRCRECPGRPCIPSCPAGTYRWSDEGGSVVISFENCLECGTCRLVCPYANISWRYPMGGLGICYRYG